jgi:hypothetical protein
MTKLRPWGKLEDGSRIMVDWGEWGEQRREREKVLPFEQRTKLWSKHLGGQDAGGSHL